MILTAQNDDADRRLDRILRKALPDIPLSALHRLLRKGRILVNGKPGKGEDRIPSGAQIELPHTESGLPFNRKSASCREQKKQPAGGPQKSYGPDILWEGEGLLILNKPAGLAVHGGGNSGDNLDRRVQEYLTLPPSLSFRPGPLNRLDKPSSGIVVFALNLEAAKWFSALLREGKIQRRYLAIIEGNLQQNEVWEDMLYRDKEAQKTLVLTPGTENSAAKVPQNIKLPKSRRALTRISPLARANRNGAAYTFARIEIETGRTHQIRAQAAEHGCPLAGDRKYGGKTFIHNSFFLHAFELQMPGGQGNNPIIPKIPKLIKAPLPKIFALTAEEIFGILI